MRRQCPIRSHFGRQGRRAVLVREGGGSPCSACFSVERCHQGRPCQDPTQPVGPTVPHAPTRSVSVAPPIRRTEGSDPGPRASRGLPNCFCCSFQSKLSPAIYKNLAPSFCLKDCRPPKYDHQHVYPFHCPLFLGDTNLPSPGATGACSQGTEKDSAKRGDDRRCSEGTQTPPPFPLPDLN